MILSCLRNHHTDLIPTLSYRTRFNRHRQAFDEVVEQLAL